MSYTKTTPLLNLEKRMPLLLQSIRHLPNSFGMHLVWETTHDTIYRSKEGYIAYDCMKKDIKLLISEGYLTKSGMGSGTKYHKTSKFDHNPNQLALDFKE